MRKIVCPVVALAVVAGAMISVGSPAGAASSTKSRSAVVDVVDDRTTGWSQLHRSERGLRATVHTSDLEPGGAYTIWWVVLDLSQNPPEILYVDHLAGFVAGRNGKHTVHASTAVGDLGIDISEPLGMPGPINVGGDLTADEVANGYVEYHVVYHGQADGAGDELDLWLSNFWSGDDDVCDIVEPPPGPPFEVCELVQVSGH